MVQILWWLPRQLSPILNFQGLSTLLQQRVSCNKWGWASGAGLRVCPSLISVSKWEAAQTPSALKQYAYLVLLPPRSSVSYQTIIMMKTYVCRSENAALIETSSCTIHNLSIRLGFWLPCSLYNMWKGHNVRVSFLTSSLDERFSADCLFNLRDHF